MPKQTGGWTSPPPESRKVCSYFLLRYRCFFVFVFVFVFCFRLTEHQLTNCFSILFLILGVLKYRTKKAGEQALEVENARTHIHQGGQWIRVLSRELGTTRCSVSKDDLHLLLAASALADKGTLARPPAGYHRIPHDARLVMTRTGEYTLACPVTIEAPTVLKTSGRVAVLDPGIRIFQCVGTPNDGGAVWAIGEGAGANLLRLHYAADSLQRKIQLNLNKNSNRPPPPPPPPEPEGTVSHSFSFLCFFVCFVFACFVC